MLNSGKQLDNVRKETPVVFNHGSHIGQRAQSSSSTLRTPTQTDGWKPYENGSPRGASPSGFKGSKACEQFSLEERAQNRRVTYGTLPCAFFTSLNPDTSMVTSVISDTLRAGWPAQQKSQRQEAEKDQWLC